MSDSKQVQAIRALWSRYWQARNHGVPWEWELPDQARVEADFVERSQWFTRLDNEIEWAKQNLLESGFEVPNGWLIVKALGTVAFSPVPPPPAEPTAYRLTHDGIDLSALQTVLDEMRVAMYRMAHQPVGDQEATQESNLPSTVEPTQPVPLLLSWREIADALGRPNTTEFQSALKRLNDQHGGPIVTTGRGAQPKVNRDRLVEWWNALETRLEELDGRKRDEAESVKSQHPYGSDGQVIPDIGGGVKRRRGGSA